MTCLNFAAALLATAASAQTLEILQSCAPVEVRNSISELVLEGIVPIEKMVRPNGALPVGSDIKAMIAGGKMEIRLRVEYQESAAMMRLTEYLATPGDPLPAVMRPSERSGSVLQMVDVSTDPLQTAARRSETFALVGTLVNQPVAWLGGGLSVDTPVTLLVRFADGSSNNVEYATVAWPGGATTAIRAVMAVHRSIVRYPLDVRPVCGVSAQTKVTAPCCPAGLPGLATQLAAPMPSAKNE